MGYRLVAVAVAVVVAVVVAERPMNCPSHEVHWPTDSGPVHLRQRLYVWVPESSGLLTLSKLGTLVSRLVNPNYQTNPQRISSL